MSHQTLESFTHHFEPKPNHFAKKNVFFPREVDSGACVGAAVEAGAGGDDFFFAVRGKCC